MHFLINIDRYIKYVYVLLLSFSQYHLMSNMNINPSAILFDDEDDDTYGIITINDLSTHLKNHQMVLPASNMRLKDLCIHFFFWLDNISNIIICSDNEAKLKCKEIEIEKSIWDCRLMYGIGMILSHLPLSFISSHFFLWNDILISR